MELKVNKIRESLVEYFTQAHGCLFKHVGELKFFRQAEHFLFASEVTNADGSHSFIVWRPDKNEKQLVPFLADVEEMPVRPDAYNKECAEDRFLRFTVRKRLDGYHFYLDYKEDYTFPENKNVALQKACAFLSVEKDGTFWDAVWREELKLQPGLFHGFPFYGVIDKSEHLNLLTGLNCQWAAGKIFVELHEPQVISLKKQNAVAKFDGHDFVFEKLS